MTLLPYLIRPLRLEDLSQIVQINHRVAKTAWTVPFFETAFYQKNQSYFGLVDSSTDRLRGFVLISLVVDEIEVLNLAVDSPDQGQGVGYLLLQFVKDYGDPHGVKEIFLEVGRHNLPALTLYRKHGFEVFAERKEYYEMPGGVLEDALLMRFRPIPS